MRAVSQVAYGCAPCFSNRWQLGWTTSRGVLLGLRSAVKEDLGAPTPVLRFVCVVPPPLEWTRFVPLVWYTFAPKTLESLFSSGTMPIGHHVSETRHRETVCVDTLKPSHILADNQVVTAQVPHRTRPPSIGLGVFTLGEPLNRQSSGFLQPFLTAHISLILRTELPVQVLCLPGSAVCLNRGSWTNRRPYYVGRGVHHWAAPLTPSVLEFSRLECSVV